MIKTPTTQQTAVFAELRSGTGNLFIGAVAGAGKTTTLVEGLSCLPVRAPNSLLPPQTAFVAFSKPIVETLRPRLPRHILCTTMHALGLRDLRAAGMGGTVDARKAWKVAAQLLPKEHEDLREVVRLVGLAKNLCTKGQPDMQAIATQHDLEFVQPKAACDIALHVFERTVAMTDTVDFDDMIYMPIAHNLPLSQQDYVFVDEAQDLNEVQIELLFRMQKASTRYVFVGDPRQAIYGFRGAGTDALSTLRSRFATQTLPLSVSFRCPRNVVLEARNAGFTDIQPHIDAQEGSVCHLTHYRPQDFPAQSAVLCRNTAPLIMLAFGCFARGVRAKIKGRDIGAGLTALAKRLSHTPESFLDALARWETDALVTRGNHALVADKAQCLRLLWQKEKTIAALCARLDHLFSDSAEGDAGALLLSTIHRAKGLEWPHVFLLDRKLLPSRYAALPWQQEQERNLLYVAITRAQQTLTYISSECWKENTTKTH